MKLMVNAQQLVIENIQTIEQLLLHLELSSKIMIVELNGQIIQQLNYNNKIAEGDVFEIVTFVGGG
ncbi:sulfur carrier protein ThiS [Kurthia sibirica]|uniref:Thiamine biosynthesis protein ThiS n=1 Tax=Kurthia sibirica TaxID=202750 RepID=A0A2U3ALJ7_9BACL|nr:sulfur carrier protein ThiS [Kurthia sibirica]PWI25421.1 thiamine biosynthesis protein ThiS [Kurthia sibirica]GEK34343.1 thiamine biosynthesis protein ThiS [Kurthia sibirica]